VTLKRNPQYLTPKQMDSLKTSIQRDGFCAPILVRPYKRGRYEVISGNHRFMAACELGMVEIPCVVSNMDDAAAKRLAINLNTIHGEPNPELLAPFLAELDLAALMEIHIEEPMKKELLEFDINLAEMLAQMEPPDNINNESPTHSNATCKCPKCGATHVKSKK
jgi:ParB-like chromosome segregation protein Spo0J